MKTSVRLERETVEVTVKDPQTLDSVDSWDTANVDNIINGLMTDTKLGHITDQLFLDFARDRNAGKFLNRLNWLQTIVARKCSACFRFSTEQEDDFILFMIDNNIDFLELGSAEQSARHLWQHEMSHNRVALKYGVATSIKIVYTLSGVGGVFLSLNAADLKRCSQGDWRRLATIMGKILMAPELVGLGYPEETDAAKMLLEMAEKINE